MIEAYIIVMGWGFMAIAAATIMIVLLSILSWIIWDIGAKVFRDIARIYHLRVISYWLDRLEKVGMREFERAEEIDNAIKEKHMTKTEEIMELIEAYCASAYKTKYMATHEGIGQGLKSTIEELVSERDALVKKYPKSAAETHPIVLTAKCNWEHWQRCKECCPTLSAEAVGTAMDKTP